jgi:hypothetical protein
VEISDKSTLVVSVDQFRVLAFRPMTRVPFSTLSGGVGRLIFYNHDFADQFGFFSSWLS